MGKKKRKNILLVDGTNLYLAVKKAKKTDNIILSVILRLKKVLQKAKFKPSEIYVVWDGPYSGILRRELYPRYKTGRQNSILLTNSDDNKEFLYHKQLLTNFFNYVGIRELQTSNVETDDIIAYFIQQFPNNNYLIASTDQDFYGLLDNNVSIINLVNFQKITPKTFYKKYNYNCKNFIILRALNGDKSDTISPSFNITKENFVKYFPLVKRQVINEEYLIQQLNALLINKRYNRSKYFLLFDKMLVKILNKKSDYYFNKKLINLKKPFVDKLFEKSFLNQKNTKIQNPFLMDFFKTKQFKLLINFFKPML